MANDKIYSFFVLLLKRTKDKLVDWKKSPSHNEFIAAFPNYSVSITLSLDEWDNTYYKIALYNSDGETIEEITPSDLADNLNDPQVPFRELYESARVQAMGVDAALDEMISHLSVPF